MFADYSNQERTVQEQRVYSGVRRTATRKYIECACCELLPWKWKLLQIGKEFGLEGEKLLEFCRKTTKVRRRKKEGRSRKRRKTSKT